MQGGEYERLAIRLVVVNAESLQSFALMPRVGNGDISMV
jgi:hypothetical protein